MHDNPGFLALWLFYHALDTHPDFNAPESGFHSKPNPCFTAPVSVRDATGMGVRVDSEEAGLPSSHL